MTSSDPIGNRRHASREQVDAHTIARLRELPAAILSDNLGGLMGTGLLAKRHRNGRMAGTAVTVKVRAGDNLVLHRALDHVRAGDVLVVDAGGDIGQAVTGKIMLSFLERLGAAGIVVNGVIRGAEEIAQRDFPCFTRGFTPRGPFKTGPGEFNVPVAIDTLVINPGDIVVGDGDGIVAFPADQAERLITVAAAQADKEIGNAQAIQEGRWDRTWIEQYERKYGLI
jgi:regulator of RNase E activity RraA